jgi:FKBP-type peptidyl-prolyl cis-trans isomerase SlyD
MVALKKGDFIEIEFTGKDKNTGAVFDTNIKKDAEEAELEIEEFKPFVMSVGNQMLPKGFDLDVVGKEVGKSYTLDLTPENAFGKRDKEMIRMIPTKLFHEQKINPERGMQLALDGRLVKILSNSGGRTLVDFNNPLAGKDVVYTYKINKAVEKIEDKINALQDFLFRKQFEFKIDGKKIIFEVEKGMNQYIEMFGAKIKEILGMDVEAKIVDVKKDAAPKGLSSKEGKKEEKKE